MEFINSHLIYKASSCNYNIHQTLILKSKVIDNDDCALLEVYFVVEKDRKLSVRHQQLPGDLKKCHEVQSRISGNRQKQKRFLVFINPKSGRKRAEKIYEKHVRPIFKLCGVQTDEFVTRRANEVRDYLMNINLDSFDGVIAVGGDGIYNEVLSGMADRELKDHGLDPDDPESQLLRLRLPIGVIPAGSGNYTAFYLNGTKCPQTAAIRIIMGQCISTNIASLHQGSKCSGYSGLILGFGLFGDVMKDCEKCRWMGTSRFKVVPVGSVLNRRPVNVCISYIPTETEKSKPQDISTDQKPGFLRLISLPVEISKDLRKAQFKKRAHSTSGVLEEPPVWKTAEERVVYAIDTYPIVMKPKGKKMYPHFGGDSLELLITGKCKLGDHFRQLKAVDDGKSNCYDFDFVKKINVQQYRVRVLKNKDEDFYINCDGEVIRLEQSEFEVRLHKNVVQLYGNPS